MRRGQLRARNGSGARSLRIRFVRQPMSEVLG